MIFKNSIFIECNKLSSIANLSISLPRAQRELLAGVMKFFRAYVMLDLLDQEIKINHDSATHGYCPILNLRFLVKSGYSKT